MKLATVSILTIIGCFLLFSGLMCVIPSNGNTYGDHPTYGVVSLMLCASLLLIAIIEGND